MAIEGNHELELVTIAVIAYRQEHLIREAISSALSQTYQPLEVILSDDGSSDRTFEIMEEMAAAYDGPAQVRLNRNKVNLGLIGHINRIFELSRGVLIVPNAGDDVSEPTRVAQLYEVFRSSRPMLLHSDVLDINLNGSPRKVRSQQPKLLDMKLTDAAFAFETVIGASCGWNPDLYNYFGPITEPLAYEDLILYYRARLFDSVIHIPRPLVRYRRGGVTGPGKKSEEMKLKRKRTHAAVLRQRRADLARYTEIFSERFDQKSVALDQTADRTAAKISSASGDKV
ncbi:MAG: glycosyltransferase [Paracoccus sp. (in: a-proteobacteria)]